jgi:hypothetical protein
MATLSKSSFGDGRQCHKRLWIEKRSPELVPKPSAAQQAIFDQGHDVGRWAHRLFPDGILLSDERDFSPHLQASRDALTTRKPLFEPAFAIPGAYARADILVPVGEAEWDLLEVKSASNVWGKNDEIKEHYLQDIAFQLYVYRKAGLDIRKAFLVYLNLNYVRQGDIDLHQLFCQEDVTRQVEALLPSIPGQLAELSAMLQNDKVPEIPIGPHCSSPHECSLISECWKYVPVDSVFSLTRGGKRVWKWWNAGITRVAHLPATEKYSSNQSIQIEAERTQEPYFNGHAVRQFLQGLEYPLHFLDFETIMPAVPLFDGCRPYTQVPFQFSLHVQLVPGGGLAHLGFLDAGNDDPRHSFLKALEFGIGTEGSIVSYNSGFETARLRELSKQFPDHAGWINQALVRFENADLFQPFRAFDVYHPDQHGSASIKAVLPALTDLSYDDLEIGEGGTASREFMRLVKGMVPTNEIPALRENLMLYCKRDTLAMVTLIERLHLTCNA